MAVKKQVRLANPRNVQQFLKRVVNEYYRDEIDSSKARDLGYLSKILLDSFETVEFQQRLEAIEKTISENQK